MYIGRAMRVAYMTFVCVFLLSSGAAVGADVSQSCSALYKDERYAPHSDRLVRGLILPSFEHVSESFGTLSRSEPLGDSAWRDLDQSCERMMHTIDIILQREELCVNC